MGHVHRVAFDWADALMIIGICSFWSFFLRTYDAGPPVMALVVSSLILVLLASRRLLIGMPVRAPRVASTLGNFANALIAFGALCGMLGLFLFAKHGADASLLPHADSLEYPEPAEESDRENEYRFFVRDVLTLGSGAAMLLVGGLLDRRVARLRGS